MINKKYCAKGAEFSYEAGGEYVYRVKVLDVGVTVLYCEVTTETKGGIFVSSKKRKLLMSSFPF